LTKFRITQGDSTLGGMVICETSEQARQLFQKFDEIQRELNRNSSINYNLRAGLILHDSEDKETRKQIIKDFNKNMTVDILFVFNMLLTGFNSPRLKRLYFGRKLKDHNLLQALTRVNRPYKDNRYGFIIDFADIKRNFKETNEAYIKELNRFNDSEETGEGNEMDTLSQIIEDPEELVRQMKEVRQVLFNYTTDNAEEFSSEVSTIEDKQELLKLKKILVSARDCCNIVKTFGDEELKETFSNLEIGKLPIMISEVQRCIDIINQKEAFESEDETRQIVNEAMQDIEFKFKSLGQEELKIISGGQELQDKWKKTIQSFTNNIDHDDPEYITLREAFMERFKEQGFVINSIEEFNQQSVALDEVLKKLEKIKKGNRVLMKKYNEDTKFVRVHKRIREENNKRKSSNKKPMVGEFDEDIVKVLNSIKDDIDKKVYDRNDILKKDAYFERTVMTQITQGMKNSDLKAERSDRVFIQTRISKQYIDQYNSIYV
jgi:type I restriction enzyme R subunit